VRLFLLCIIPNKLEAKIGHARGEGLEVPDDELAVPRTAGDGLHLPARPRVHPQLIHLQ